MKDNGALVIHAVTSSVSLRLMRGQLAYLQNAGFQTAALCAPGPGVMEWAKREAVPVYTIKMQREIAPLSDMISLLRITHLLHHQKPDICNAGTPKAGLLVGIAAWITCVPCRVYTLRGLRLETTTGLKRHILRLTEQIACASAHRVVCVSPSLRDRAVELGVVGQSKTVVLGNGSSNGVDS
ncbi:MAG: glycosyltransferase, partial [Polyangiaceae bacterium]|nr:glycosyltransferase [Polyangiaceae bacterium]